jgi:hypothetical protein
MKRDKPAIRLPGDEGPNPYDSKTPLDQLAPAWLTWKFWLAIIPVGIIMGIAAAYKAGVRLF